MYEYNFKANSLKWKFYVRKMVNFVKIKVKTILL